MNYQLTADPAPMMTPDIGSWIVAKAKEYEQALLDMFLPWVEGQQGGQSDDAG